MHIGHQFATERQWGGGGAVTPALPPTESIMNRNVISHRPVSEKQLVHDAPAATDDHLLVSDELQTAQRVVQAPFEFAECTTGPRSRESL